MVLNSRIERFSAGSVRVSPGKTVLLGLVDQLPLSLPHQPESLLRPFSKQHMRFLLRQEGARSGGPTQLPVPFPGYS